MTDERPHQQRIALHDSMLSTIEQTFTKARALGVVAVVTMAEYGPVEVVAGTAPAGSFVGPHGLNELPVITSMARYGTPTDETVVHVLHRGEVVARKALAVLPTRTDIAAHLADPAAADQDTFTTRALAQTRFDSAASTAAAELLRRHPEIYGIHGHSIEPPSVDE